MARERMDYDILIVGAGPAGLSAAIKLGQLAKESKTPIRILVLEKGSEVGAQLISGAVLEPRALNELIPDWESKAAPLKTKVEQDSFCLLSKNSSLPLPTPPQMRNAGNYIISLGQFCRWLARQAENLGVEIFPGFAAVAPLFDEQGSVKGVITNDFGINRKEERKPNFVEGLEIHAKYTLLAEGARGSLSKILSEKFELAKNSDPQTFGLGIKELWEIDPEKHKAGKVLHTVGWPLDARTYGGSFLYHFENNLISLGLVVGLDYENPYLDIFEEFQRFKQHPKIRKLLEGGRRIAYGARAINEGGLQSIPKLEFPGGMLIGCAAGFLNVPKIKGNHTAMKSGMIAGELVFKRLQNEKSSEYNLAIQNSWIGEELKLARNIRPGFRFGLWGGLLHAAIDTYLLRGRAPWTLHQRRPDNLSLKTLKQSRPIQYPKHDNVFSFDKLSSVALSNVRHEEDQPCHLVLKDRRIPIDYNLKLYDAPEQRYCPAAVYEIIQPGDGDPYLQINASNCIHCKTCDIKDPKQNITWVPPEGGGGPNYLNM